MKKFSKNKKRPLNLMGLQLGHYAKISSSNWSPPGYPLTEASFMSKIQQYVGDLKLVSPSDAPFSVVIECRAKISFHAVIPLTQQGGLINSEGTDLDKAIFNDAEEIAHESGKCAIQSIDIGNQIATDVELEQSSLESMTEQLSRSQNENIARKTYARSRGPKTEIDFPTGEHRSLGGNKIVPLSAQSSQKFTIKTCYLSEINPGRFKADFGSRDEELNRLQSNFGSIDIIHGEINSPIMQSLRIAAAAGIPVDLEVSVSEKISNRSRWIEPIKILNRAEIFSQTREWLSMLEETLVH